MQGLTKCRLAPINYPSDSNQISTWDIIIWQGQGALRGISQLSRKCCLRDKSAAGDGAQSIQQRGKKAGSNSRGFHSAAPEGKITFPAGISSSLPAQIPFFPCRTNTLQSSCCTFQPPEHFPSWHSRVLPGTLMEAAPGWKMQGQGFEGSRQDMKLKTGQKKKVILAN